MPFADNQRAFPQSFNLYGYTGCNPINRKDLTGRDANTVKTDESIYFIVNINIYGDGATDATATEMQQNLNQAWNNNGKGWEYKDQNSGKTYHVNVVVTVTNVENKTIQEKALAALKPKSNNIEITNDVSLRVSECYPRLLGGCNTGRWQAVAKSDWVHELGHLLGLDDRYIAVKDKRGDVTGSRATSPEWKNNIMRGSGNPVERRNIDELINLYDMTDPAPPPPFIQRNRGIW